MTEETSSQVKVLDALIDQVQTIYTQANRAYLDAHAAERGLSNLVELIRGWRDNLERTCRELLESES